MLPDKLQIPLPSGFTFEMIFVEGDTFMMGDNSSEYKQEKPEHEVNVSSFYLGKYPVTQQLWQNIMGNNPSVLKGENLPVETVSWDGVQEFIRNLILKTDKPFRLPTEAEWEYAARGGKYSQGYTYSGSDKLKQVGWYRYNSGNETHDVGLLLANELGLYDMSGNVWEWCEDDWHDNYNGAPKDGSAWMDSPNRGDYRVLRGGSCFYYAENCRPPGRFNGGLGGRSVNGGFRLALSFQSVA